MIYLIRHGESEANVQKLFGTNLPLTGRGVCQARELNLEFSNPKYKFGLVVSSVYKRAVDTARIVFDTESFVKRMEFNEIYFGRLEGKKVHKAWYLVSKDPYLVATKFNGDNPKVRAIKALSLIKDYVSVVKDDIAIVTHGLLIEGMLYELDGKDWKDYKFFKDKPVVGNCEYVTISEDRILRWGELCTNV